MATNVILPDDIYSVVMEVAGNEKVGQQILPNDISQGAWRVELVSSQFLEFVGELDSYSMLYIYPVDLSKPSVAIQRVKDRLTTMRARFVRDQNALVISDISNITYALVTNSTAQTGQFNFSRRK